MRPVAVALLSTVSLLAQSPPAGYQSALRTLPAGAGAPCLLPDGTLVYCTGTALVAERNGTPTPLLQFPGFVFGSFTRDLGAAGLLFGESTNGGLWLLPPNANPRLLATLAFNYDAAPWRRGAALVSAKTGGFAAPDNELWAVDLQTGATDLIARLPGASGPLAVGPDGTVFYATASNAFPPPPGSSDVLAFSAAQIQGAFGATFLTRSDARLVAGGFDSAGALALDDDGDLFLVDWAHQRVLEIDDLGAARHTFAQYPATGISPGGLQFLAPPPAPNAPVFEPFQPERGRLVISESDFASVSQLQVVAAARPALRASAPAPIPVGPFTLQCGRGPALGTAVVFLGLVQPGGERPLPLPGAEAPLFFALDFNQPWLLLPVTLDAQGAGTLPLSNPGGIGLIATQALVFDATPQLVGSSGPAPLGLAR